MEISQIRYFLELKKHQHMSVAADILNISQPALSKSISALEAELGVKLFDRVGRQIYTNENGHSFAKYAEQALQLLNQGIASAKDRSYDMVGAISIMCYAYAPILTECCAAYSQLNPYVTFGISNSTLRENTRNLKPPDFILSSSMGDSFPQHQNQFWIAKAIFREDHYLIALPELLTNTADKDTLVLSELSHLPFITMLQQNIFFQDVTYSLCHTAGFYPKIYCQTDSFLVKTKMVEQGLAVALIPSCCVKDALALSPRIRAYGLENCNSARTVYLLRQKEALMTEASSDFWEYLINNNFFRQE